MVNKKKVLVAMSGGVDSSVTAALLKKRGYEVVGVTMQIWPDDIPPPEDETGCCSLSAVEDARSVANKLDIPFYVMNFKQSFNEKVIQYFIGEYIEGKTPNPCVACNKFVKFDELLKRAMALDLDYVATGHYGRIFYDDDRNRYLLARAKDDKKDQSYVLYGLTQEQLSKTLLPLGDFTKEEVRKMAEELGLKTADKPESQEICFIPDNDYRAFLKDRVPEKINPGPFLDTSGKRIGTHRGIPFYTIGQRKGLGLALGYPVYVVDINYEKNAVIVGTKEELYVQGLISEENNFILFDKLEEPLDVYVKIRYKSIPVPGTICPLEDGKVKVKFEKPARAVTPGQAVVFYKDELVVGGGTIVKRI